MELAGKSSLSCWGETVCLSWGHLECDVVVAEDDRYQRNGWEAERSCGDTGCEGMWCRGLSWRKRRSEGSDLRGEG